VLDEHFDVEELVNQTSSFVLFLSVEGRWFAYTAGHGHALLDNDAPETGFGLRVAANMVDPAQLRVWENRTVDTNSRQRRSQMARAGDYGALGVEPDASVVRFLSGDASSEDVRRIEGADSLRLRSPKALQDLHGLCRTLLASYSDESYKDRFPEIDAMTPLRRGTTIVRRLDEKVSERLAARDATRLGLAPLGMEEEIQRSHYAVLGLGKDDDDQLDELDLDELYALVDAAERHPDDLYKLRIVALDDDGAAISRDARLRDYLVAEVDDDGKLYALASGRWYRIDADYVARVTATLHRLPDMTETIHLDPIKENEDEDDYNARVASERGWVLLDKKVIYHGGRSQKIEFCDLLTDDGEAIHVKKLTKSAGISHLCKQVEVAARLLQGDDEFRAKLDKKLPDARADALRAGPNRATFVYAIATDRSNDLVDSLFFFSKVAIEQSVRAVRGAGFEVGLARIGVAPTDAGTGEAE
jgi:uncharacterized protein (TIGR04141 family)